MGARVSWDHPAPAAMRAPRTVAIPSASMADVAFLLLVFFLAVSAIQDETGLRVDLPTGGGRSPTPPTWLAVTVGADGAVLLTSPAASFGAEARSPEAVRAAVASFVGGADPTGGAAPLVSLQAHRRTPYASYVAALDAVLLGHRDAGVEPRLGLRDPAP